VTAQCTDPTPIISDADLQGAFVSSSGIVYTLFGASTGSVHSAALDGTADTILYTTPPGVLPDYVTSNGPRTYWVDDGTSDVHCSGCAGADAIWITGLNNTSAIFADPNSVYALASDPSNTALSLYGCSGAACSSSPAFVIPSLPTDSSLATLGSDGTKHVFASRTTDIISVDDLTLTATPIVQAVAQAIVVDGPNAQLFYGSVSGAIVRTQTDGTQSTTLSACAKAPSALAFDAAHVYVFLEDTTVGGTVYAIPRN
jgi:hypothetical protein